MTPLKCYEGNHPRIEATKEFMDKNRLNLCRQQQEIKAEVQGHRGALFGFKSGVLLDYLSAQEASEFLSDIGKKEIEKNPSVWNQITDPLEACQDFLDYMVFAWMKAMDERGLSAARSISKLSAYLWLLGREDLAKKIEDDSLYAPYGTPALIAICEDLGIEAPDDLVEFSKKK